MSSILERRGGWRVAVLSAVISIAMASCSSDSDILAGLWDYDENELFHAALRGGILLIEEPCIYIIDDHAWIFPPLEELPDPVRVFVKLPRKQTQYNPDTQSIWVHNEGPMTSGDRVWVGGGGPGASIPDICSTGITSVFTAIAMWEDNETVLPGGEVVSNVFAGLWDYDAEAPFHTAKAEGLLLVEGPCVYIVDDYSWLLPYTPLEELPEPVRIFVNLPREQTRYDLDTGSIWVHDYGPITSGDRVEIVGGGINPNLPDTCSVGVDRAVNVKSMMLKQCKLWFPLDHWSQIGCHPSHLDPLAGLWDFQGSANDARLEGLLWVEEPCVYVIEDYGYPILESPPDELPESRLIFLNLPRDPTRYDPDTSSIWVHGEGPMVSGDRVVLGGGFGSDPNSLRTAPHRAPPKMCSAGVESQFTAGSMQPRLCSQYLSPDHPSQVGCKPVVPEDDLLSE